MNKFFFNGSIVALALSCFACGTAVQMPASHAGSNDRDGIATSSEEIEINAQTSKVTLVACDIAGNEDSLWSIPASNDDTRYTRTDVMSKLNELYGSAPRLAVQDCNADPNEPASDGVVRLLAAK